jgi:signal transduction histidine kinase
MALLSLLGLLFAGEERLLVPAVVTVLLLELLAERVPRLAVPALVVQTVAVTAVVVDAHSAMVLPLLLVPAYRAGEQHGTRAALVVGATTGAAAVAGRVGYPDLAVHVQWSVLALVLGLLGAWNRRVEGEARRAGVPAAREAGRLLGRVQDLARQLPTGLDVPAVASLLLEEAAAVGADRGAVLVRSDDVVTPVALLGVDRVPWRDPLTSPGTPHDAWHGRKVVRDVRLPDSAEGRRQGSSMLAVPLADRDDELLGLLVLERETAWGFGAKEQEQVERVCERYVAHLHAAIAFSALRHVAEVGERERLAREMHDGVAQDLSALGFVVDSASRRAAGHPEAQLALTQVRTALSRTISDIRLSIADLRSNALPERGLGAAVTSHVHALAAHGEVQVTVSISESPFRLPAHVESVLLRLVQQFLADVRARADVSTVEVALELSAPHAIVRLERDGAGTFTPDDVLVDAMRDLGGVVRVADHDAGVRVRMDVGVPPVRRPAAAPAAGAGAGATAVVRPRPSWVPSLPAVRRGRPAEAPAHPLLTEEVPG